jgi:hypothetical protein
VNKGVNITPRGKNSPLGARGEVKNGPQGRVNKQGVGAMTSVPWVDALQPRPRDVLRAVKVLKVVFRLEQEKFVLKGFLGHNGGRCYEHNFLRFLPIFGLQTDKNLWTLTVTEKNWRVWNS